MVVLDSGCVEEGQAESHELQLPGLALLEMVARTLQMQPNDDEVLVDLEKQPHCSTTMLLAAS